MGGGGNPGEAFENINNFIIACSITSTLQHSRCLNSFNLIIGLNNFNGTFIWIQVVSYDVYSSSPRHTDPGLTSTLVEPATSDRERSSADTDLSATYLKSPMTGTARSFSITTPIEVEHKSLGRKKIAVAVMSDEYQAARVKDRLTMEKKKRGNDEVISHLLGILSN